MWDSENAVFLEWNFNGTLLQSVKATGLAGVSFAGKEVVGVRSVARAWHIVSLDRTTGQLRELIPAADTFVAAHFGLVEGGPKSSYAPVTGVWSKGFVVAEPGNYAVALYRWDGALVRVLGRQLSPMHASAGRIDDFLATFNRQAAARGQPPMDNVRMAMMRKQALEAVLPASFPAAPFGSLPQPHVGPRHGRRFRVRGCLCDRPLHWAPSSPMPPVQRLLGSVGRVARRGMPAR